MNKLLECTVYKYLLILIIKEIKEGNSFRSVAKKFGLCHTTISRMYRKFLGGGLQTLCSKSGKKKKLLPHEVLNMKRIFNSNHFLSDRKVRDDSGLNEKISIHTTKRYLQRLKLFG